MIGNLVYMLLHVKWTCVFVCLPTIRNIEIVYIIDIHFFFAPLVGWQNGKESGTVHQYMNTPGDVFTTKRVFSIYCKWINGVKYRRHTQNLSAKNMRIEWLADSGTIHTYRIQYSHKTYNKIYLRNLSYLYELNTTLIWTHGFRAERKTLSALFGRIPFRLFDIMLARSDAILWIYVYSIALTFVWKILAVRRHYL